MRWVSSVAAVVSVSAVALPCHAASLLGVRLDGCSALSEPEVRRVVSAELEVELVPEPADGVTTLVIRCADAKVKMTVVDGVTRKSLERSFDLDKTEPEAWSRLVAIAAAELVATSWSEIDLVEEPALEPVGPPPAPEIKARARRIARGYGDARSARSAPLPAKRPTPGQWRIVGFASMRRFFTDPGTLLGGSMRLGYDRGAAAWAIDVAYERGTISPTLGRYSLSTATLGGSVAARYSASGFDLRGGIGVRVGMVSTEALAPDQPQGASALALWGWPMLVMSISTHLSANFVVELSGETSYAVLPVQPPAGDLAVRAAWFSLGLGFGWAGP